VLPFYLAAHLEMAIAYAVYYPSISKTGTDPYLKKPACFFYPNSAKDNLTSSNLTPAMWRANLETSALPPKSK